VSNLSKVIPQEELAECERWIMPAVQSSSRAAPSGLGLGANLLTAGQIEQVQRQAYEEGFALGRREGLAAGQAELHAQVQRLDQMMRALSAPFEGLDQQVEQELLLLTTTMLRQLVRRELKTDPGQVIAVVREAMASLPVASRNARLYLHPEDAVLVRDALAISDAERPWRIMEDPVLTRGGCRVITDTSSIDASVETRLAILIATVLGGVRDSDSPTQA
jgi:flagellar assembly protein FliH